MQLMPTQSELLKDMSALSAQMVRAAQSQDWEGLVVLEQSVSVLRNTLISDCGNTELTAEERKSKAALIQRILDDDAEVRRHTEPWMEHVRQLLGGTVQRRRVENAYNTGPGSFGGSFG